MRRLQVFERLFQLGVLIRQLVRELLHQIEALHFQGVAPEHFQRLRHVSHLVVAADLHRDFEVALGHGSHGRGESGQAPDQVAAHEDPTERHGADDVEHVQHHQNDHAGVHG